MQGQASAWNCSAFANVFKYPAFSFGPRYAAATGTSLLEGYRRQGLWALVLYAILTLGTMFTVQAVVTVVTAAIGVALLGWSGSGAVVQLTIFLTVICAVILLVGDYRWLDRGSNSWWRFSPSQPLLRRLWFFPGSIWRPCFRS